jgi:hypothetical protein
MKPIFAGLVLVLIPVSATAQTPSECAVRLLMEFSQSVVELNHRAERASRSEPGTLELFVSTPLQFQRAMEDQSEKFRLTFYNCPRSVVVAAEEAAEAFQVIAEGYGSNARLGNEVLRLLNKGDNTQDATELQEITEELKKLRLRQLKQTAEMQQRLAQLPGTAALVFDSIVGQNSTKDDIALLLSESQKRKLVGEITEICAGQCVSTNNAPYPYAAVALILEGLNMPFPLNGMPLEN